MKRDHRISASRCGDIYKILDINVNHAKRSTPLRFSADGVVDIEQPPDTKPISNTGRLSPTGFEGF